MSLSWGFLIKWIYFILNFHEMINRWANFNIRTLVGHFSFWRINRVNCVNLFNFFFLFFCWFSKLKVDCLSTNMFVCIFLLAIFQRLSGRNSFRILALYLFFYTLMNLFSVGKLYLSINLFPFFFYPLINVSFSFFTQDYNLVWNSTAPKLTRCFHQTILNWIPTSFLWLFSIYELTITARIKRKTIPWNFQNRSRLICTFLCILLNIFQLLNIIYRNFNSDPPAPSDFYAPLLNIASFVSFNSVH